MWKTRTGRFLASGVGFALTTLGEFDRGIHNHAKTPEPFVFALVILQNRFEDFSCCAVALFFSRPIKRPFTPVPGGHGCVKCRDRHPH